MEWFGRAGWSVFFPVTHSPDVDLVVLRGDETQRVQVKTSRAARNGRYEVTLCTRGGNQSWNGITNLFSPTRCDLLFVLVADGRRWCIPSARVAAGQGILLGGPKYAAFEVERGLPFDGERGRTVIRGEAVAGQLAL